MKRILSLALVCAILVVSVCALASCGNISQSYADKVNEAAEKGENLTLDQVKEDLGSDAIEIIIAGSGVVVAVDGVSNLDELEDKFDNGETVKGIVVTFLLNKATSAKYGELDPDDIF